MNHVGRGEALGVQEDRGRRGGLERFSRIASADPRAWSAGRTARAGVSRWRSWAAVLARCSVIRLLSSVWQRARATVLVGCSASRAARRVLMECHLTPESHAAVVCCPSICLGRNPCDQVKVVDRASAELWVLPGCLAEPRAQTESVPSALLVAGSEMSFVSTGASGSQAASLRQVSIYVLSGSPPARRDAELHGSPVEFEAVQLTAGARAWVVHSCP
jgi:hypothetical protein